MKQKVLNYNVIFQKEEAQDNIKEAITLYLC